MGILRADRITGLGGANAITGSTFFGNSDFNSHAGYLRIETGTTDDFAFGTGDFTIEFWFNRTLASHQQHFYDVRGTTNTNTVLIYMVSNVMYYFGNGSERITSGTVPSGEWVHFALVRSSGSTKMYFNGTQTGSTYSDSLNLVSSDTGSGYIGSNGGADGLLPSGSFLSAHLSNFRVQKGKAEYTAAFTPPTNRLEKTPETVLLTCNSSSDASNDEAGKVVIPSSLNSDSSPPKASRFTPNSPVGFSTTTDVGGQYGTTFDGFGNFASSSYMVPPAGNTRERNRGRALFAGASTTDDVIQKILIQSTGNAEDFGDLSGNRYENESAASSTRGVFAGGYTEDTSPNQKVNIIEFVTIAVSSNATDFGDLTQQRGHSSGASNATRGIICGGSAQGSPYFSSDVIDFFTIATTGNASDFGDATTARKFMGGGRSSTTRALFCGGNAPDTNAIDFVTIATTGNAQDFGDCTQVGWAKGAGNVSSGTRAVLAGGYVSPTNINVIEFLTIATLGNGTDFGDLAVATRATYAAGSKTRGIFGGGKQNPASAATNTISFVTIANTGNASDFGDMINSKSFGSGLSDCHGGLE